MNTTDSKADNKFIREVGTVLYVIYYRPSDFPNDFVVREWRIEYGDALPQAECKLATTLEEARSLIPSGCYRIPRDLTDDLVIVETWL